MDDKGKNVYVNRKTYDLVVKKLGLIPSNLFINPYLPDNQALLMGAEELKYSFKHMEYKPSWGETSE